MTTIYESETRKVMTDALSPGDDVLIHAALGDLGTFEPGVEVIIEALLDAVGSQGTVVMMTDTRSFAKTGQFSIDMPSETGLLTERFRQRPGVHRSLVPMISFAAQGARADEYLQTYHSHTDPTAAMTRLLENDGKILLLGIGYSKCTLYHLAEERHESPYNFYKTFEGVLSVDGKEMAPITQRYFVRRDTSVKKDPAIAGRMLEERNQAKVIPIGNGLVRVFRARDFDACCMDALSNDPDAFLSSENTKNDLQT